MATGTKNSTNRVVSGSSPKKIPKETIIDALKKLVIGAGKADGNYNRVSISSDKGRAYDGTITTTIKHAFGFTAKLYASDLSRILSFLKNPTIKVGAAKVTFSEEGKVFYLTKLATEFIFPEPQKPEKLYDISGDWLQRLQCVLPSTTSAFGLFNGVLACKQGFVGTDRDLLGHVTFTGPETEYIIPNQLLQVLPKMDLRFGTVKGTIYIETDATIWTCPAYTGKFPPWQKAFFKHTTQVTVQKRELRNALRAAGATSTHTWIEFEGKVGKIQTFVLSTGDLTNAESSTTATFSIEKPPERKMRFAITIRKLLGILDSCSGDFIDLRSDNTFSRLHIIPTTAQPKTEYLTTTVKTI